jgi:DNA-binding beta-propeller fold protein YncE
MVNRKRYCRAACAGAAFIFCVAALPALATDAGAWLAPTLDDCLVRITPSGSVVKTIYDFYEPQDIDIYEADGSVWVVEPFTGRLKKMTKGGSIVKNVTGLVSPVRLAINQRDGSVWVTEWLGAAVSRWSRNGTLLARATGIEDPIAIAVNPKTGNAWTCSWVEGDLVKISPAGSIIWRIPGYRLRAAAVIESTGQCYIAGWYNDRSGFFLVNPDGSQEWNVPNHMAAGAWHVRVDQVDGSCWFGQGNYLFRYSRRGRVQLQKVLTPSYMSVNGIDLVKGDRSVWVGGWEGVYKRISRSGSVLATGELKLSYRNIYSIGSYAGDVAVEPMSLGKIKALFE